MNPLVCRNEQRREAVRKEHDLNGLDYLEVGADQRTLTVYFLGKAPVSLEPSNILIEGGQRIRDIKVKKITITQTKLAELDDFMEVVTDKEGDFSTYTLRVVAGRDKEGKWKRHPKLDAHYDRIEFSFKADCPSDLDCKQEVVCPPEQLAEPEINYLAKDYASFRQLILDRLALVMPDWKERHVLDLGITLVELLAYVGDHLSYYQDAVATEAYLDTARQRISVRRHVRLVDYPIHEGCNARTWVCVKTESNLTLNPRDIYFITVLDRLDWVVKEEDVLRETTQGYEVFEPMTKEPIRLYAGRHKMYFHTWGDKECCLPRGTTKATLKGDWVEVPTTQKPPGCEPEQDVKNGTEPAAIEPSQKPHLKPGDVLIVEEVIGPKTGNKADADPKHRHAVRLTDVRHGHDPLSTDAITEITWAEEDALPFPLCLSAMGPPQAECEVIENISVAQGNIILVDHGITVHEDLDPVPVKETIEECDCLGGVAETVIIPDRYEPTLKKTPLTFSQPIQADASALRILTQDVRQALPQVILTGTTPNGEVSEWLVRQDLLASGNRDLHCVVESDNDGHARLRFGDDELGRRPEANTKFHAVYRVGNGPSGNVGAGAVSHLVYRTTAPTGAIKKIGNPLPASGGTAPEPLAEVKLFAPHAFRKRLERAITPADYAAIVQREFPHKVQRAAAQLRWNGSWYEILVAVDPLGREEADAALLKEIEGRLYRYRRIGHDLVVKSAHRVPLDIELLICVLPSYLRGHVKVELLDLFSNRLLPDGRLGFFHPDNLTFGEGIYLSTLIAMAQAVPGVESVKINKLERLFDGPNGEIENGVLPLGPLEIARVDNDPSVPENGRLVLDVRGGR